MVCACVCEIVGLVSIAIATKSAHSNLIGMLLLTALIVATLIIVLL